MCSVWAGFTCKRSHLVAVCLQKCFDPTNPKDAKELLFTQLAQFTVLSTQLVVDFAKQMPGFTDIGIEDQIKMLKVGINFTIVVEYLHGGPSILCGCTFMVC